MIKRRCGFRFLNETLEPVLMRAEFAGQRISKPLADRARDPAPIHLPHSARTYFANDAIVGDRGSGEKFSHW